MVVHKKGHKNSKGEKAEWCIVSHETGKILSSHKSKSAAKKHLSDMHKFKHMGESMSLLEKAIQFLNRRGFTLIHENQLATTSKKSQKFEYSKWLYHHFNGDFAAKYGPDYAYQKALNELAEEYGYDAVLLVPADEEEFRAKWGFGIDEDADDDIWY